jgi:hypothetical protein
MRQARGCLLLLVLKQHLKQLYGFTDASVPLFFLLLIILRLMFRLHGCSL